MIAPQPAAPAEAHRPAGACTLTPPHRPSGPDSPVRPPVRPPSRAATVRVLVSAVAGSVLAGYAAVVALVSLLSTTANADWSLGTTLRSAAPLWLAVHQVPLTITVPGGAPAPLGVLPLLPTLGLAVLVARAAAGVTARLDWHTPAELATLAVAFAGSTAALGVAVAIAEPTRSMTASPVAAAAGCAATAGLSALWGGLRAVGFSRVALTLVPPWMVRGVLAGLSGLVALLAAGALFTFGGLALSAGTAHDVLGAWGDVPGGRFGVTVLSIAYLPNAIVGATSWTMGPGLSVGAVSVSLFGTSAGALPPVPLLAVLPEPGPAPWRVLVFVLPLLAGLLVARRCRHLGTLPDHAPHDPTSADLPPSTDQASADLTSAAPTSADPTQADPAQAGVASANPVSWALVAADSSGDSGGRTSGDRTDRLHVVVTAGVVAAAGCFVLAVVAGGRLGGGAFDPVRIPAASLAIAAFVWIVLPAGIVTGFRDRSTWRLPDPHRIRLDDPDHHEDPDHADHGDHGDADYLADDDPDHADYLDPDADHADHLDADHDDTDHLTAADPDQVDDDDLDADHANLADTSDLDDESDDGGRDAVGGHVGDRGADGVVRAGDVGLDADEAIAWHDGHAADQVAETVVWYAAGHDDDPEADADEDRHRSADDEDDLDAGDRDQDMDDAAPARKTGLLSRLRPGRRRRRPDPGHDG